MLDGPVSEYCEELLSITDSTNNTPLHIACAKGNVESVKVFITIIIIIIILIIIILLL